MSYLLGDANGDVTAGRVALLDIGNGSAVTRYVEISNLADANNPPESTGLIITGGTGGLQASAQTRGSLGNSLFSYGFGRQPGTLSFSGVAFSEICGDAPTTHSETGSGSKPAGLRTLVEFFNKYNQGVYDKPVQVTLQPTLVKDAFLLGLNWNYSSAGMRLIEFQLNWMLLP